METEKRKHPATGHYAVGSRASVPVHNFFAAAAQAGLSLRKLAYVVDVPLSTLCRWKTGASSPRLTTYTLACERLSVYVEDPGA